MTEERAIIPYQGAYRIISRIASGGMGTVYLGEQMGAGGFQKTVGIKTIRSKWAKDPRFRELLIAEGKLVADLIHENIQQVYHLVEFGDTLAIIMEWVHGVTFEDINTRLDERNDYLPPDLAVFLVSRVARALSYAHRKRDALGQPLHLVHRDVNPVNVFTSWQGVVKLADFGIAKARTETPLSHIHERVGKAPYMSPEQVFGRPSDARSDIFALGLVLFEMLTGEQLHPVESMDELPERHKTMPLPDVRSWNPDIDKRLSAILERMLAQVPQQRYQTAGAVVSDLEHYMYSGGYGPTNEKLASYLDDLFPEVDKNRLLPEEIIIPRTTPGSTEGGILIE
jgi:serine/threonine protein kinase